MHSMGVREILSVHPRLVILVIYILGKSADNPQQIYMVMCLGMMIDQR